MFVLVCFIVSLLFILGGAIILKVSGMKDLDDTMIPFAWALMAGFTGYVFMFAGLLGYMNIYAAAAWLIILLILAYIGRRYISICYDMLRETFNRKMLSFGTGVNIVLVIAVIFISISFIGAMAPPSNLDVFNYHFALLQQSLQAETLVFNPTFFYSATPFTAEMLSGFITILSNFRGGQFIQFIAGIVLLSSIFFIGRKISDTFTAIFASIIFLCTMFFPFLFSEAKNDQLLTLFSFLSLYAFARAHVDSNSKYIMLGAVFGGLAGGVKLYGLGVAGAGLLVILAGIVFKKNTISVKNFAFSVFATIVIASPWFLRSFTLTGNPFHPFFNEIFSDCCWDAVLNFKFSLIRDRYVDVNVLQFLLSPFRLTFEPDAFLARVGPIYLSILPAAMFFRQRNRLLNFLSAVSVLYFILWFLFLRDARYLMPILPGLALYCAGAVKLLYERGTLLRISIILVILLNLAAALSINFRNQYQKIPVVISAQSEEEFYFNLREINRADLSSGKYVRSIPEFRFLENVNKITDDSDAVGLFSYNEPFIYYFIKSKLYLLLPLWQKAFDFKTIEDFDDLETKLDSSGITCIITDTGDDPEVPADELLRAYPEFKSSLTGANILLDYLNNNCEMVIAEGKYRCFKLKGD